MRAHQAAHRVAALFALSLYASACVAFEQYWPTAIASAAGSIPEFRESASAADDAFIAALKAFRQGRFDQAYEQAAASAQKNDARGQVALGYLHLSGRAPGADYAKAAGYFLLAAGQGSALAPTYIGVMYEYGLGFPRDRAAAARYYEQGAKLGSANAMARLANLKFLGSD